MIGTVATFVAIILLLAAAAADARHVARRSQRRKGQP